VSHFFLAPFSAAVSKANQTTDNTLHRVTNCFLFISLKRQCTKKVLDKLKVPGFYVIQTLYHESNFWIRSKGMREKIA